MFGYDDGGGAPTRSVGSSTRIIRFRPYRHNPAIPESMP